MNNKCVILERLRGCFGTRFRRFYLQTPTGFNKQSLGCVIVMCLPDCAADLCSCRSAVERNQKPSAFAYEIADWTLPPLCLRPAERAARSGAGTAPSIKAVAGDKDRTQWRRSVKHKLAFVYITNAAGSFLPQADCHLTAIVAAWLVGLGAL